MIGRLTGRVVSEEATGTVVLDVNGVGYEVFTPVGSVSRAAREAERVTLHVHTHLRQDTLDLFGFASEAERRLFRLLILVPNVGPKTALGTLSALPVEDLRRAVAQGDLARLTKVPGIGKKTAERLLLELKGKLAEVLPAASAAATVAGDNRHDILNALLALGYSDKEAQLALKPLPADIGTSDGIRQALKLLSKA